MPVFIGMPPQQQSIGFTTPEKLLVLTVIEVESGAEERLVVPVH
jgi:hypothetical protein